MSTKPVWRDDDTDNRHPGFTVALAATFTVDPIEPILRFWFDELGLTGRTLLAPYDQVVQELVNPSSLLSTNAVGLNIVLLRVSDWIRDLPNIASDSAARQRSHLTEAGRDFVRAATTHRLHASVETLVVLCPSDPDAARPGLLSQLESFLCAELSDTPGLQVLVASEFHRHYEVGQDEITDPLRDAIGHIPYQDRYYGVLGTLVVRHLRSKLLGLRKVVVVDCDNTLWDGVVGELGAGGVRFDAQHTDLHQTLKRLAERGVLVCLCSKNEASDVWQVFETREDFVLSRDDLVASAVNWEPKADNLRQLASRLNLGLDSFVFLDDNPVECASVRAHCPEVLTLEWPLEADRARRLLRHVWELDANTGTKEDERRTELYRDEFQRQELKDETLSFTEFIESLELVVDIRPLTDDDVKRASQLTLRTNQFNFTSRRRTERELQALVASEQHVCRVVDVKDRFGDYGLVGVLIGETVDDYLLADTFLLSCRVLGRGVEHRMAAALGAIGREQGLRSVRLQVTKTRRNAPARDFVDAISTDDVVQNEASLTCTLTAEQCAEICFDPGLVEATTRSAGLAATRSIETSPADGQHIRTRERQIARAAYELFSAETLQVAIQGDMVRAAVRPVTNDEVGGRVYDAFADALAIPHETLRQVNQLDASAAVPSR